MLPDLALLGTFDFCVDERGLSWRALVHVCRKWRNVVFGSPRRLGLRLYYDARTSVDKALDVWPPLPIIIKAHYFDSWGVDNILAALQRNDRICHFSLSGFPSSQLEKLLAAMQRPFPALTHLRIWPGYSEQPPLSISASFLDGVSPRLQTLDLCRISFPGLPKLILSATHLVTLSLEEIPRSGYISPEEMVTCLSELTRLETLCVELGSPQSFPDQRSPCFPPRTRTLLPALTKLRLQGVDEYLEDFAARIDAPLLSDLIIIFFQEDIYDTPQVAQFISRIPKFESYHAAQVVFSDVDTSVALIPIIRTPDSRLELRILYSQPDDQLLSQVEVCSSSFPQTLIANVDHLYLLAHGCWNCQPDDNIENGHWLDLLRPFTGVRRLYIHSEFTPYIMFALQDVIEEGVTEVLPALRTLFWQEKPSQQDVWDAMKQFVAARRLAGFPITVNLGDAWQETDY